MDSSVQSVNYDAMNTIDPTEMDYYDIKFVSETYTLQEDSSCDRQVSTYGELVLKYCSLICMKENTKWYCEVKQKQQVFYFSNTHYCTYLF